VISRILEKTYERLAILFGIRKRRDAGSHLITDGMREHTNEGIKSTAGETTVHGEEFDMIPVQFLAKHAELRDRNDRRKVEFVCVYVLEPGLSVGGMIHEIVGAILVL
jgi:hypothetical protein